MFQPNLFIRGVNFIYRHALLRQYLSYQKNKIKEIRAKAKIKVLFVVGDVSMWKTEFLYKAMLKHDRFQPILGTALITADLPDESLRKYNALLEYITQKEYDYIQLYSGNIQNVKADIIFYQQPYDNFMDEGVSYRKNLNSLFCYAAYGILSLAPSKKNKWVSDLPLHKYCWHLYFENEITSKLNNKSYLKGQNSRITGIPFQDVLFSPKSEFVNPWKGQECIKKKIIWAPHHTIPVSENPIQFSTFLDVSDIMLLFAEKYKGQIQFVFKPHPFLKRKLNDFWGEEKTNDYYNRWATMDNTQIVEGDYLGLFKYSDAMIHDCVSFTIEYCYTKNPVMYLIKERDINGHRSELNEFGQRAFDLHTHGCTKEQIKAFIQMVAEGKDDKKDQRVQYYNDFLLPPCGKSACENIINAILGQANWEH